MTLKTIKLHDIELWQKKNSEVAMQKWQSLKTVTPLEKIVTGVHLNLLNLPFVRFPNVMNMGNIELVLHENKCTKL